MSFSFPIPVVTDSRNWTIFQEMLKGVVCIHEAGIIHRDLKVFESFRFYKNKTKWIKSNLFPCCPQTYATIFSLDIPHICLHQMPFPHCPRNLSQASFPCCPLPYATLIFLVVPHLATLLSLSGPYLCLSQAPFTHLLLKPSSFSLLSLAYAIFIFLVCPHLCLHQAPFSLFSPTPYPTILSLVVPDICLQWAFSSLSSAP